jgi:sarcosine oxidase
VLLPEKAISLFVKSAQTHKATVVTHSAVHRVSPVGDHVEVRLESGEMIVAGSAVIAAGSWIRDLVPELGDKMTLTRQPLMWFEPKDEKWVRPENMPVFFLQTPEDLVYGFPNLLGSGVKAASHLPAGELATAGEMRAEVSEAEKARLWNTLDRLVPAAAGRIRHTHVCVYTRSPDEHFVLGLHPDAPQIVLASPCSGHGFKFASIFGEILADLATMRATDKPIDLFSPKRLMS